MTKKIILITVLIISGLTVLNILGKNHKSSSSMQSSTQPNINTVSSNAMSLTSADSVEIINFFGTQRCVSCIAIGTLTKKTLDEKFSDELKSGKIVFREINGELPENKDIVNKYQARGSSLFINAIRGQTDHIVEDTTVWRLVNNEEQYIAHLEKKLNSLIGK